MEAEKAILVPVTNWGPCLRSKRRAGEGRRQESERGSQGSASVPPAPSPRGVPEEKLLHSPSASRPVRRSR